MCISARTPGAAMAGVRQVLDRRPDSERHSPGLLQPLRERSFRPLVAKHLLYRRQLLDDTERDLQCRCAAVGSPAHDRARAGLLVDCDYRWVDDRRLWGEVANEFGTGIACILSGVVVTLTALMGHWWPMLDTTDSRWSRSMSDERDDGMATLAGDLPASANLRDLGSLPSEGGRRLRRGQLYRSAMINVADQALLGRVRSLGLQTIVDLRDNQERMLYPTPCESVGCTHYWCHDHLVGEGNLKHSTTPDQPAESDGLRGAMISLYRRLPAAQAASYRVLFEKLAEKRTPLLLHCAAGKDRTGVGIALVLAALQVPRDAILDDYLRSNEMDRNGWVWMQCQGTFERLGLNERSELEHLIAARADYLDAMFAEIDTAFGSIERYAERALGINGSQLQRMRRHLLEPA